MPSAPGRIDLWSGVGIVVANMIGAGVFVSAGFMAQDMGPGTLLLAWVVGAVIALAGTRAYSAVAVLVPRSGGEYRYLSDLLHPALGYLAGWATLLVGFSAPVAIDALAAASFAGTLFALAEPRLLAAGFVLVLTGLHAFDLRVSKWTQNLLVVFKAVLVTGFVALGLGLGSRTWPSWTPPHPTPGFPLDAFVGSLFFVAFAFSGWNAAAYSAEEFHDPKRDVPRAMAIGCGLVAILYLLVNWVFVANLTPARALVATTEMNRVTLGHLVVQDLIGPAGARLMSAVAVVALLSAMSAMTFAGPRVYAAMARDGFLPRFLAGRVGRPPAGSVFLQGALAALLLFTHDLRDLLQNVGAILVLFAALTALALFRVRFGRPELPRPPLAALCGAGIYVGSAAWMLYIGFRGSTHLLAWVVAVMAVALIVYAITHTRARARAVPLG